MSWRKALVALLLTPLVAIALLIGFLWATYISDPVTSGSAYGFQIGESKEETAKRVEALKQKYPEAVLDVTYGSRAGDHLTMPITNVELTRAKRGDHWQIDLRPSEGWNFIRLNFTDNSLVQIYRHRQYFELP